MHYAWRNAHGKHVAGMRLSGLTVQGIPSEVQDLQSRGLCLKWKEPKSTVKSNVVQSFQILWSKCTICSMNLQGSKPLPLSFAKLTRQRVLICSDAIYIILSGSLWVDGACIPDIAIACHLLRPFEDRNSLTSPENR
jgi:hypothetical protein